MQSLRKSWMLLLALALGNSTAGRAGAAEPSPTTEKPLAIENIEPARVYALVLQVQRELELIRVEIGKPRNGQPPIAVKNAAPREVYFQAQTLFRKADRLSFEQTRERATEPVAPEGRIGPADVLEVVQAALARVRHVKNGLKIEEEIEDPKVDSTRTSTDVFHTIVDTSRQVNLMLDQRFSPSDVFQQVTLGVGYSARLLSRFPDVTRLPEAPPFERGKQPRDVYRRLTKCFQIIQTLSVKSGLDVLSLETSELELEHVTPSDVYDIAALVVSELDYLHSRFENLDPPRDVFYPGLKFPSHVYQRVGILEKQLQSLGQLVADDPKWIGEAARDDAVRSGEQR